MAAVVTFGVTVELLSERYFPTELAERSAEMATEVIEEIAADLEPHIRAANAEPEEIAEATSPRSYRWLQSTILVGAAAEVNRRIGGDSELSVVWDEKYQARMRDLRNSSNVVLADVAQRKSKTRTLYGFR